MLIQGGNARARARVFIEENNITTNDLSQSLLGKWGIRKKRGERNGIRSDGRKENDKRKCATTYRVSLYYLGTARVVHPALYASSCIIRS